MASRLFFHTADDGTIILMGRLESDDGMMIGDYREELRPGQCFGSLSHAELLAAGAGEILAAVGERPRCQRLRHELGAGQKPTWVYFAA